MSIPPSPGSNPLKILVVDDHPLVREGLRQVLLGLADSVHVLDTATASGALDLAAHNPDLDLVLLDYRLPDVDGLEALLLLLSKHPALPVLVLSGSVSPLVAQQVMENGASGFVNKTGNSEELLHAIKVVLDGGEYISDTSIGANSIYANLPKLTPRQQEVLLLLLEGYSNKVISRHLNLSEETTKNHITAILRAFQVSNRTQVVAAARRLGWLGR